MRPRPHRLATSKAVGSEKGLANASELPSAPLLRTPSSSSAAVNTDVSNVRACDMASSSENLTPIAVVDDHDTDFFMSGMYPEENQAIFRDMLNMSYMQTLTHVTLSSWTGSYTFNGTYTRVAVYICLPPTTISNSQAAFASYTIDGTLQSTSYVPFTNSSLFIPRFAHFSSGLLLAIPGGHHNLTIQVSADPSHPYLLDYILLWDEYLGSDHPYPGSPTYVSTFAQSPTPIVSTAYQASSNATLSLSGPVAFISSAASAPGDALPSASSAPPPSSPASRVIVSVVVGGVVASAALLAVSYLMYRRHRKHGQAVSIPLSEKPDDPRSPLMAEADAPVPVVVGPLGPAERHPYDVPTDTMEGRYSTLVRHQTGKGKIKEIRLQPSQMSLDASNNFMPGTSASSSVLFEEDNLPLYSSSSAQASQTGE